MKPTYSWESFIEALSQSDLVLTQASIPDTETPISVQTRTIEANEASVVGSMLGVEGSSLEELKGSFYKLGRELIDTKTGFRIRFAKDTFRPDKPK